MCGISATPFRRQQMYSCASYIKLQEEWETILLISTVEAEQENGHHCTNNLFCIISYSAEFSIGAEKYDKNPIPSHTISIERESIKCAQLHILRPNAHSKWRLWFDLIVLVFYKNTSIASANA